MNKVDLRKILERKLFEQRDLDGDELQARRVSREMASNYPLKDLELILAGKKPIYFDPRITKWVYLN